MADARERYARNNQVTVLCRNGAMNDSIHLLNRFAGEHYDRFDALATTQQKIA